jgi:putative FmdB family regulatory protein
MPVYCYSCNSCDHKFEIKHSMSYEEQVCLECKSSNIFKVPSLSLTKGASKPKKVGKVVDDYIKETKALIKTEKQNMKTEVL